LGLQPLSLSFDGLETVPYIGQGLKLIAIMAATLFLHDVWFYWAHRIEHKVPFLWEFHKLHHSEERMNSSTWARDHFLQAAWRAVFPAFTFGLVLQLGVAKAASVGVYATFFTSALSMFYHSGVRLHLPWLNAVLVTPQVHRIHHSVAPAHHNKNFADFLPVFDIVFGTYRKPRRDEFPETGLGPEHRPARNILSAQLGPLVGAARSLLPKRQRLRHG
jgi:sterol desaturase/sphingolipid hydroxylase (fatty acid hydroxylase superfamily)